MANDGVKRRRGRPKGSPNKATVQQRKRIEATGETPLDYMLRVMRDESQPGPRRDDMAKAAAPYVHPKQPVAVQHSGEGGGPIRTESTVRFVGADDEDD